MDMVYGRNRIFVSIRSPDQKRYKWNAVEPFADVGDHASTIPKTSRRASLVHRRTRCRNRAPHNRYAFLKSNRRRCARHKDDQRRDERREFFRLQNVSNYVGASRVGADGKFAHSVAVFIGAGVSAKFLEQ